MNWISIKDNFPNENEHVIALIKGKDIKGNDFDMVIKCLYTDNTFYQEFGMPYTRSQGKITHWIPMPNIEDK